MWRFRQSRAVYYHSRGCRGIQGHCCQRKLCVRIGSPNQGAREDHIIGSLLLLFESVCVVVRDPLICIPCDVFNCCLFVVMHRDISFLAVLVENVLGFVVGEIAIRSRARALLCAALHHTMVSRTNSWDKTHKAMVSTGWLTLNGQPGLLQLGSSSVNARPERTKPRAILEGLIPRRQNSSDAFLISVRLECPWTIASLRRWLALWSPLMLVVLILDYLNPIHYEDRSSCSLDISGLIKLKCLYTAYILTKLTKLIYLSIIGRLNYY